ncbi:hypothetical protein [Streptomyces sp. NPDC101150]|uniref:hypothetical protein n=1 Tax=Streptomyces sp. NPDC101150 TaxID=3366114 RepID=UPI0037FED61F
MCSRTLSDLNPTRIRNHGTGPCFEWDANTITADEARDLHGRPLDLHDDVAAGKFVFPNLTAE